MDVFTKDDLRALLTPPQSPCISIYLPAHRAMPDTLQDPIRFKNLLNEAERRLNSNGSRPAGPELLEPARELLSDFDFWQHQSDGLAVFIAPGMLKPYRVPLGFEELLVVADHFHVKPMLPLLSGDGLFYILALSQKQVRLLRGSKLSVEELPIEDVPQGLGEVVDYARGEKQTQYHTRTPGSAGERNAMFHGHGAGNEDLKVNLLKFCREVDRGLRELLHNETGPLVLAAVEYLHPIYREANTYKHLLEPGVNGNPEGWSDEELHTQAWKAAQSHFEKEHQSARERYEAACGRNLGLTQLEQVVPAAHQGRVDTLFVATGLQEWGSYNPEAGTVVMDTRPRAGNEDLLNFAAVHTILNGGQVFAMKREEMPEGRSVAAALRY